MNREKKLASFIKGALRKDFLYSDDEIHHLKKELFNLKVNIEKEREMNSKGFKPST